MALFLYPPLTVAGGATETKQDIIIGHVDGIEGALSTLNAKDFATEATSQKLRKWPYANFASITPTEDATEKVYTYKTSGGATVGTITITKATGVISYSPDKVV
jgi:hypothetical protein